MKNAKCYAPQILVGTEGLPREQWLEYRRKGIGGSDAAAVLGISPFRTGRDLYYDKLNIVTADDAENWVQLEVGTLLEPLVAKIFAHKTGYKIYRRPFMFRHPLYPWMLADLDYMVELPDGTTAILEIKTTNYNAKDNWWYNGEEIVPIYYESQGRHYMTVMNIDRVYFCCLYGNSEDEAIIRRIDRDMAYEEELIALERDFWENHVLTKTPPPYVEADGDLILESLRRKMGPADKDAPPVLLGQTQFGQLSMILSLQEQKKTLSADVNKLDKDIKRLKGIPSLSRQVCAMLCARAMRFPTVSASQTAIGSASSSRRHISCSCARPQRSTSHTTPLRWSQTARYGRNGPTLTDRTMTSRTQRCS